LTLHSFLFIHHSSPFTSFWSPQLSPLPYVTADVFTTERFGGNPLAVIPDARAVSDATMQRIAAEFNYSETAFVLPPGDPRHTARVRIFTPTDEVPFAGHPNVGTAFVLGRAGQVCGRALDGDAMHFEEGAGLVTVRLLREAGTVVGASIRAPRALEVGHAIDPEVIAACASLDPADVITERHGPAMVSVGLPFALAEVAGLPALACARPDAAAFAAANARYPHRDDRFSVFLYAFTDPERSRIRARMFAPLSNTPEDPATGSASGALGAYLVSLQPRAPRRSAFVVEQGIEMGRPSLIEVLVSGADGSAPEVWVQGRCVAVMRGVLDD
jgi:trans-2,3-dihydro-3-hydroxyanthranilate isomerase